MTDKEIIKALECCVNSETEADCYDCPYYEHWVECNCLRYLFMDSIDLINRQKAEIERLEIQVITYSKKNYIKGIKDFAKRLKMNDFFNSATKKIVIDNLVKEMIGEGNESIQQEDR